MTYCALAAMIPGNDESEPISVRLPDADEATLAAIVSICAVDEAGAVCVAVIEVAKVEAARSVAEAAREIAVLSFKES